MASATANSAAMRSTVQEPKPGNASSAQLTPVPYWTSATYKATTSTGSLLQIKAATLAAGIKSTIVMSVSLTDQWQFRCTPTASVMSSHGGPQDVFSGFLPRQQRHSRLKV